METARLKDPRVVDHVIPGMQVHAVIVNYRTPAHTAECATSLMQHADVPTFLRIVDTSDGPGALTADTLPPNVPVEYESNVGYARALNVGFRSGYPTVQAPYWLALNADTRMPEKGLAPLVALMNENPKLAVIGPRQVTPDGTVAHAGITECGNPSGGRWYGEPDTGQGDERCLEVEQVSGSVMLMRAQAVESVGGVPTETGFYYEDALLCHRLRTAGWLVGYSGLVTYEHHVAASPTRAGARVRAAAHARAAFQEATR